MSNLLKMERYHLFHNFFYWSGLLIVFSMGLLTADTYILEVMGPDGGSAASLADIFNGMVYDSTFLLIIVSSILSFVLGQEFSCRTLHLEVSAGHSRKEIFISQLIVYLIAFHIMALLYPIAGCFREFGRFGIADVGGFFYNILKASVYSLLMNSAIFLLAMFICYWLQHSLKAAAITAVAMFVLSLYLGYGMMLNLPVAFLPTYQIREVVSAGKLFHPAAILIGVIWISVLVCISWLRFRKCDLK